MAISKALLAAIKAMSMADMDVKKNYEPMRKLITAAHPKPMIPRHKEWDQAYDVNGREVTLRVFSPDDSLMHPIIIYFHGGGWVTGNLDSYDRVCGDLSIYTNRVVVSVDYALAPEYKFPVGLEECYEVAKSIYTEPQSLFRDSSDDFVIMGDSAGGNLAAAVALMARERGEFTVKTQVLIYPATGSDHYPETSPYESVRENGTDYILTAKRVTDYMELYSASPEDFKNPLFAPILSENLSGMPRTLVLTAEFDPLRDEGELFAKRLLEAGNDVLSYRMPDALHGFFSLPISFDPVWRTYVILNHFLNGNVPPEDILTSAWPTYDEYERSRGINPTDKTRKK